MAYRPYTLNKTYFCMIVFQKDISEPKDFILYFYESHIYYCLHILIYSQKNKNRYFLRGRGYSLIGIYSFFNSVSK